MRITSNGQLYEAVSKTAADLTERGMKDDADKLHTALSISTVPGEILGAIRFALQRIDRDGLPQEHREEIVSEIAYLDSILD
jgi:hypothetical protein